MGMIRQKEQIRAALRLYFVMGSVNCTRDPVVVLREALEGGITLFQYREKGAGALEGGKKIELGRELQQLCRAKGVPFIVNDDLELALLLDADGIHIGQDDISLSEVRQQMKDKIVGVSAHTLEEASLAVSAGADYLGVGPMYATLTKPDAKEVQGPQLIAKLRANGISFPIVGIGGIGSGNAGAVIESGADGIAVITAISYAKSGVIAAGQLLQEIADFFKI